MGSAQWGKVDDTIGRFDQDHLGSVATVYLWSPIKSYDATTGTLPYKLFTFNTSRSREGVPMYRDPDVMRAPSMIEKDRTTGYGISAIPGSGAVTSSTDGHLYIGQFAAPTKGISFTTYMKLMRKPQNSDGSKLTDPLYVCFTFSGIKKNNPDRMVTLGKKYVQIWGGNDNQDAPKGMQAPETIGGPDGANYAGNTSPEGSGYMQIAYAGNDELEAVAIDYTFRTKVTGYNNTNFNGEEYNQPLLFPCFMGGAVQVNLNKPHVDGITDEQFRALGQSSLRLGNVFLANEGDRTEKAKEIMGNNMMNLIGTPQNQSYLLISLIRDRFLSSPQKTTHRDHAFTRNAMSHMSCFSDMTPIQAKNNIDTLDTSGPLEKQYFSNGFNASGEDPGVGCSGKIGIWAQPFALLRTSGKTKANLSGALIGAEYTLSPNWTFGCALGMGHNILSEGSERDITDSAKASIPMIAPYLFYQGTQSRQCKNIWSVMQSFVLAKAEIKGRRKLTEDHLNHGEINSDITENIFSSNTYVGWTLQQSNSTFLTPYVSCTIVHDRLGAFSETINQNIHFSESINALLLSPSSHVSNYAAPEIGCQYSKNVQEINCGYAEYFISASSTFLYNPNKNYDMNYVNSPLPYTIKIDAKNALYGSVSLGAKLSTLSKWSMGLMGRVDISRHDTIYRAMAYIKKSF